MNKVLIFSTAYLPFIGGAEIAIKELTDRIGDFEFDLITSRLDRKLPSQEKLGRVNVYRVGFGNKFDKFLLPFLGLWGSIRLDRARHYQIIFSLMASQASIAAALFKIIYPGKKLILNLQEGDEEEYLRRYAFGNDFLYKWLIRPWHLLVFKKADLIIALSGYLKNRALANGVKCPVEIVPNGVDIEKFKVQSSKFKVEEIKNILGIKEGERVLITTSRLVKKNAVDDIIKSLTYLPENIKLLILGDGQDRNMLENLAKDLKLKNRVIFFGEVANNELPSYLAIADVFVRPSLSEGQGVAFLEAMAAGVPIIATPVGGIVDFLIDGETGLFCQVKNPKSIAEKIDIYLADQALMQKIKAQAKKLMAEKYDWDLIALKMKNIFDKIII